MKYEFKELVDVSKLQALLDALYKASGIPSSIIGMDGTILAQAGWQKICTDFHRRHAAIEKDCIASDLHIQDKLEKGEPYVVYTCPRGLTDASAPIRIEGDILAKVFTGQLFTKAPDAAIERLFREQARHYGFDEEAYMQAFREIPVFPDDKLHSILNFLTTFAQMVAEQGLARKRELEAVTDLQETQNKFQAVFKNSPVGIVLLTASNDKYVDINDIFINATGYTRAEIIGHTSIELRLFNDPLERGRLVEEVRRNGAIYGREVSFRTKSGEIRQCLLSMTFVKLSGQPHILSSIMDITSHKQAEEARDKLKAQLLQSQKMESIGRLAGGVAHDFNNMLQVIMGHLELALMQVKPSDNLHADLLEVQKAAQRSADLTRQLLTFARKQTIVPRILDFDEAISGFINILRRLIGEDIELSWNPGANLWAIKMDPVQIGQILTNLCVNARDAISGSGKIAITASNISADLAYCAENPEDGLAPGEYVRLTVSDNGCGMEKSIVDHIFEPFFTTKSTDKGTGLGLSTVYGIVRQNAGFINIRTHSGKGTIVNIHLPRMKEQPADVKAIGQPRPPTIHSETILIVEDEPVILRLTKRILHDLGYVVLTTGDPHEAILIAEQNAGAIQLLIADLILPKMNGRDLATKLAKIIPGLKCLFMSGQSADVIAQHSALDTGVCFIQKPFARAALASKVSEVLDKPA